MTSDLPSRPPVTPGLAIRSLLFALGQVVLTPLFSIPAVAVLPLPYRLRYRLVVQWTFLNLRWLAKTCRLTHTVEGIENIPGEPAIVFCKHESAWETLALQRYFSPQVWVIKRELLRIPFFGWALATLRPIAIDRDSGRHALDQILEQGRQRLADGCWVVVFPEGTRVAPGHKRRYRLGGSHLAQMTGVPVVPVAHDSGDYWPRKSFIKWPGSIRLVIGPSIDTTGRTAAEINRLAEEWIEGTMQRLRTPQTDSDEPAAGSGRAPGRVEETT